MLESEMLTMFAKLTQRVEALEAQVAELKGQSKRGYLIREAAPMCGFKTPEGFLRRLRALGMEPNGTGGRFRVTREQVEAVQRGQLQQKNK